MSANSSERGFDPERARRGAKRCRDALAQAKAAAEARRRIDQETTDVAQGLKSLAAGVVIELPDAGGDR